MPLHLAFYLGSGSQNPGPPIYEASILLAEPSRQMDILIFIFGMCTYVVYMFMYVHESVHACGG